MSVLSYYQSLGHVVLSIINNKYFAFLYPLSHSVLLSWKAFLGVFFFNLKISCLHFNNLKLSSGLTYFPFIPSSPQIFSDRMNDSLMCSHHIFYIFTYFMITLISYFTSPLIILNHHFIGQKWQNVSNVIFINLNLLYMCTQTHNRSRNGAMGHFFLFLQCLEIYKDRIVELNY